jgi:hypothetical protein
MHVFAVHQLEKVERSGFGWVRNLIFLELNDEQWTKHCSTQALAGPHGPHGALTLATQALAAKPIIHDGEYYFLKTQYEFRGHDT